jgi:hypothetical protein
MPVPDTYFYFFDKDGVMYQAFLDLVESSASKNQVMFIKTSGLNLIPNDGWVDYAHVNTKGAAIFSEWLGIQIGQFFSNDPATVFSQ